MISEGLISHKYYQRELPHVVALLETQDEPQEARDIHAEGEEAVVGDKCSQEVLCRESVMSQVAGQEARRRSHLAMQQDSEVVDQTFPVDEVVRRH